MVIKPTDTENKDVENYKHYFGRVSLWARRLARYRGMGNDIGEWCWLWP